MRMRRVLIPLIALAMIVSPLLAGEERSRKRRDPHRRARVSFSQWQHYASTYSPLTYDFIEGRLAYRVPTSFGDLNIKIHRGESEVISLSGPDDDWTVVLHEMPGGVLKATWSLGNTTLTYDLRDNQDPVMIQQTEDLSCDPIWSSATRQALFRARVLLVAEFSDNPAPPESSLSLLATVQLVASLVEGLSGCQDVSPDAAGCYYDYPLYDDCALCCEADAEIFSIICLGAVWGMCQGKSCRAMVFLCGGLMQAQVSMCISHNCRGKVGDPTCDDNMPCQGACMSFCGPGYSGACGDCPPDSPQQACCK